ncbi:MAG: hypothetical protein U5L72_06845 [Bacteroidales bacterium]|nr:hypothetical protein [Bacteroidales bacterium]
MTLVPDTATELTVLVVELTLTVNAEAAGMMLARDRLYVSVRVEGVALSITELR